MLSWRCADCERYDPKEDKCIEGVLNVKDGKCFLYRPRKMTPLIDMMFENEHQNKLFDEEGL